MSNSERGMKLKKFFESQSIKQEEIALQLGCQQSYISKLYSGKDIGKKVAQKISDAYGLSVAWLMTGEGNMMLADADIPTQVISNMTELPDTASPAIPLFKDEYFALGEPKGFALPVEKNKLTDFILCPNLRVREGDFAVIANGDSMRSEDVNRNIPHGAIVCLRKWEESFIEYGETYAVAIRTGYTIKRIYKGSDAEHIICRSNNPEYEDFELDRKNDIFGLAKVVGVLTLNNI